jgi:hypothetical protein
MSSGSSGPAAVERIYVLDGGEAQVEDGSI